MDINICIVGMGLIGGSLAKAAMVYTSYIVFGIDNNATVLKEVEKNNAADKTALADTDDMAELLAESDIVILALSPQNAINFMQNHAEKIKKGAVVTDVCGVKCVITEKLEPLCTGLGLHFIGGHPMAGKERGGFENSDTNLFDGASYILTPSDTCDAQMIDTMAVFAHDIGCKQVEITTPAHHDEMIAFTSQLPHVLAGAYIKSPASKQFRGYSAGSFRDVSRVATVDEKLWSDLFLCNKDNLCSEIDGLINRLREYKNAIQNDDQAALTEIIKEGRMKKEEIE